MIYSASTNKKPSEAHTVGEFIEIGQQTRTSIGYKDLTYVEKRNGLEFSVKNLIDDYWHEIIEASKVVKFSDKSVRKYRFNPKLLAYDLYGNTRLYYIILRLNGMCNVHDFSLENHNVRLLEPADASNILAKIQGAENMSLRKFTDAHKDDKIEIPILPYVYKRDPIARFKRL